MTAKVEVGLYGKLPAYGDFISRNLESIFIDPWDDWLQRYISNSREQIDDNWLEIYLTSPIWRFVFSPGVINENTWLGLMMPSVDKVGRNFPISIVGSLPGTVSTATLLAQQGDWFKQLEAHCLKALDGELDVDELIEVVSQVEFTMHDNYESTSHLGEPGAMVVGLAVDDIGHPENGLTCLLDARLSAELSSYSLWQTTGSDLVAPVIFCCQGFPAESGLASMLDGCWQQRNWKIPYNLTGLTA